MKKYDMARFDYDEAIRVNPNCAPAYNGLARIRATCPDEIWRDGKRAVEFATRACELTAWKETSSLDMLAAAHAETGEFDKAVRWQEKANMQYTDADERRKGEERLKLYKEKKPYRQTE
jgi:tetratricopeptide (TPR) repeat protein